MATSASGGRAPDSELHDVDWEAVERTPEFQELVSSRRRFVIPATIFFLAWYMGFIALASYAPDFMAESVIDGLTVGYCLALTQFVMVAVLGIWYLRRADKVFDPLADKVARMVDDRGSRFTKGTPPRTTPPGGHAATPPATTEPEVR
jgi:uncharacterized membrane protein (DUF485 family)